MADVIKRLKYYKNQFLQEPDFTAEQEYHLDRQRRHNRQLHTPGIAHGLTVTLKSSSVEVAPGTAIDDKGQQIVLHETRTVGFEENHKDKWVFVVISYEQVESDVATVGSVGDRGPTRYTEAPKLEAILDDSNAPSAGERIRLARLQISPGGTIINQDMGVRTPAGARLRPEETLERLKLSRQGVPEGQWPVLSSGAAGRADVAGDLNVTGSILVTGNVDGRDISADAAVNQAHRDNLNNPHAVTATQVGAIVSIEGVSNAGGNIDLIGANGISIAGNDGANTITITGGSPTSIANVSNPGGNIAVNGAGGISVTTGVNAITINGSAPSTIANVSNPGGNIAVNGTGGISVTTGANAININGSAPSTIANVSNPGGNIAVNGTGGISVTTGVNAISINGSSPSTIHGVSNSGGNITFAGSGISIAADNSANVKKITFTANPATIGALPVDQYLQRTLSVISFGTGNVSGATSTITLAFQPKMIWSTGRVYAQTVNNDDTYFGGVTHGYCKVNGPGSFTQYGHGPTIRRYSQTFGSAWGIRNYFTSGMAIFDFDDRYVSPRRNVLLGISITSVTSNQIVLTFTRDFRGWNEPIFYFVELYITILG